MKKTLWITMAICLLTACGNKEKTDTEQVPVVKIDTARTTDGTTTLQFPARVVSASDARLSFKVAGTLKKVYVGEGDHVRAGQLVAELDNADYTIQYNATKAEYAHIKADAERVMSLYAEGATTASNYDKARYGLQQIEAKLQNHANQLAYTRIYAPYDGNVQECFFHGGETVGAGMPVLSILGSGAPELEVNLPAQSYVNRSSFRSYSCTLDVLPGEVLPLTLVSILPKANANQLYTMRLRLNSSNAQVAPGMSAWVNIATSDSVTAEVRVPATSLLQEKGHSYIYIYNEKNQSIRRTEVSVLSLHTDGTVVVQGADVMAGTQVVSSGVHHVKDGDRVRLLAPQSKTNVGGLL